MKRHLAHLLGFVDRGLVWLTARDRWVRASALAIVCLTWLAVAFTTWFLWSAAMGLPTRAELQGLGNMSQATTLLDAHDAPIFQIYKEQRVDVPLAKMSPLLAKAILSVEDQRFYDHHGVDAIRMFGAILADLRLGRRAQGGSTSLNSWRDRVFSRLTKRCAGNSGKSCSRRGSSGRTRKTRSSSCI